MWEPGQETEELRPNRNVLKGQHVLEGQADDEISTRASNKQDVTP